MATEVRPLPVLDSRLLWDNPVNPNVPNWRTLLSFYQSEGSLNKQDIVKIIQITNQLLKNEPNLLLLQDPVALIGDIHGQYYDLIHLLKLLGEPGEMKFLFMGDYVDRGAYSLEVITLLMALKISYPAKVFLLRGNHETRQMATMHSFRQEILRKKNNDQEIFDLFMHSFDLLPMAAVVNGKYFCVHGGISPHLKMVQDINSVNRVAEVPLHGIMSDLVWADPVNREDGHLEDTWTYNRARGTSFVFGAKAALPFLQLNKLKTIFRAHEVVFDGFKQFFWEKTPHPQVCTIFSAPNYTDIYQNLAAFATIINDQTDYKQFLSNPHPYNLHKSRDLFDYTIPIISTKLVETMSYIFRRFTEAVEKSPNANPQEVADYLVKLRGLEQAAANQKAIASNIMNDQSFVDKNGNVIDIQSPNPRARFQAVKINDMMNESLTPSKLMHFTFE